MISDFNLYKDASGSHLSHGFYYPLHTYVSSSIKVLNKILSGTDPSDIPFTWPDGNGEYYFDKMDMDRFKIDASHLPERPIIYNVPPTFYEKNKNKVWIIFLLFFLMLVCSVFFLTMWLKTVRERNL